MERVDRFFPYHNEITLTKRCLQTLIEHCLNELPLEACGILSGNGQLAKDTWLMKNVDQSPVSFSMSLDEIDQVFKAIQQRNQDVIAIFHSHPTASAFPSPGDIRYNNYSELVHIIVSLKSPLPEVKAFRIVDQNVREISIKVI